VFPRQVKEALIWNTSPGEGSDGTAQTLLQEIFNVSEDASALAPGEPPSLPVIQLPSWSGEDAWNPGKTVIYPVKVLPSGAGIISSEIVDYCHLPRPESKILGKFRRFGDLNVKNTLRRLVKQGILRCERKGRLTVNSFNIAIPIFGELSEFITAVKRAHYSIVSTLFN